jgi:hypothetical protein
LVSMNGPSGNVEVRPVMDTSADSQPPA